MRTVSQSDNDDGECGASTACHPASIGDAFVWRAVASCGYTERSLAQGNIGSANLAQDRLLVACFPLANRD